MPFVSDEAGIASGYHAVIQTADSLYRDWRRTDMRVTISDVGVTGTVAMALTLASMGHSVAQAPAPASAPPAPSAWTVPDVDALPDDPWGRLVRRGRELTVETYAHIGPEVANPAKRYAGSNMACQSCHLEAGTKEFGLPFVGVYSDFPQYRPREGAVGSMEDRVNGCMTRSMNGRALPEDGAEMRAYVAYLKFLSTGRPVGGATPGRGSGKMPEMSRPADPSHGHTVFAETCAACHGEDGLGKRRGVVGDAQGYEFPPLWGPDSFNDGAGMGRLIGAANFIHSNMPIGTVWDQPLLSPEDAWDVAAYVESQPRPHYARVGQDYPVRTQKPADAAYPPFADGLPAEQHRYGPFQPIRDAIKRLRASGASTGPAPAAPAVPTPTTQR